MHTFNDIMRICDNEYPDVSPLDDVFAAWPFPLSSFQKHAIEAIRSEVHVLVTAHTASGKTLCADYAIQYHVKGNGKKLIYTAPIKALNNQKFHEFQTKFPDISFGILTGDIKFNPDADVLIMTTEILRNTLFQRQAMRDRVSDRAEASLQFAMNIERDLACVVFDEVHYINDADRGKVWEESIMMLPNEVSMVMLSATLDKADKFAGWIENVKEREVWLCPTEKRVVPLSHYSFITFPASFSKKVSPSVASELDAIREKPILLKDSTNPFEEKTFHKIDKLMSHLPESNGRGSKFFVMNRMVEHLKHNQLLPAITFVFSRKQTELLASKIQACLFPEGSKAPSVVESECRKILAKLPNFKEYLKLPEYQTIMSLLRKGVAFHNAGVPQVFREMIEMLFDKGYIRLLFATETFAVGINMPAKSVVFTSLSKWDGKGFRVLHSHEYSQMAGRAGRRGIDEAGYVFHMTNLIDKGNGEVDVTAYKSVLNGKAQVLESKFQIHFNLLLRLIAIGRSDFDAFVNDSMITMAIESEKSTAAAELVEARAKLEGSAVLNLQTPVAVLTEYERLLSAVATAKNKKRRTLRRQIGDIEDMHRRVVLDYSRVCDEKKDREEITRMERTVLNINSYVENEIGANLCVLSRHGFIEHSLVDEGSRYQLTDKGKLAADIQEVHCLAMADVVDARHLDMLDTAGLVGVLSCFAKVSLPDENKVVRCEHINAPLEVLSAVSRLVKAHEKYYDIETTNRLAFADSYELNYDMCELMLKWCAATDEAETDAVCAEAKSYGICLGEFMKAILKINNIGKELERLCVTQNNLALLGRVKEIPVLILKSIATDQSLYV